MIRGLPYDAEIEYLESTGTQYIETGLYLQSGDTVSMMASASANGNQCFWSARQIPYPRRTFTLFRLNINQQLPGRFDYGIHQTASDDTYVHNSFDFSGWSGVHEYKAVANKLYIDDVLYVTAETEQFTTAGPARLLASESTSTPGTIVNYFYGKVYCFKVVRNGTTIMDLHPVRVGNIGYFYDRVTKQLFGNAGTGEFVRGPDKARPVLPLHRYGASRFGKIGVGARMMRLVPPARDYIQDGLVAMWDGIENAGWGIHDPNATSWVNLVAGKYPELVEQSVAVFSGAYTVQANSVDLSYRALCPIKYTAEPFSMEICARALKIGSAAESRPCYIKWGSREAGLVGNTIGSLTSGAAPEGEGAINVRYTAAWTHAAFSQTAAHTQSARFGADSRINGCGWNGIYSNTRSRWWTGTGQDTVDTFYSFSFGTWQTRTDTQTRVYCVRLYNRQLTADEIAYNYAIDKERFDLP